MNISSIQPTLNMNKSNTNFSGKNIIKTQKKVTESIYDIAIRLIEAEKKKLDVDKDVLLALLKGFSI